MKTWIMAIVTIMTGLCRMGAAEDTWTAIDAKNDMKNNIQIIYEAKNVKIMVGTQGGLLLLENNALIDYADAAGKKLEAGVYDILETDTGEFLFSTAAGVFQETKGQNNNVLKGYTVAKVTPIAKNTYIAMCRNLRTQDFELLQCLESRWDKIKTFDGLRISNMIQVKDGRVFVSIEGDGLREINPTAITNAPVLHLKGAAISSLGDDSAGGLWCGLSANGMRVFDGKTWTSQLPKLKSTITGIEEDNAGRIWVSTNSEGLYMREKGATEWKNLLKEEGLLTLCGITRDGRLWISNQAEGGLRYWDGKQFVVSSQQVPYVRSIIQTRSGFYIAGTPNAGILQMKAAK